MLYYKCILYTMIKGGELDMRVFTKIGLSLMVALACSGCFVEAENADNTTIVSTHAVACVSNSSVYYNAS